MSTDSRCEDERPDGAGSFPSAIIGATFSASVARLRTPSSETRMRTSSKRCRLIRSVVTTERSGEFSPADGRRRMTATPTPFVRVGNSIAIGSVAALGTYSSSGNDCTDPFRTTERRALTSERRNRSTLRRSRARDVFRCHRRLPEAVEVRFINARPSSSRIEVAGAAAEPILDSVVACLVGTPTSGGGGDDFMTVRSFERYRVCRYTIPPQPTVVSMTCPRMGNRSNTRATRSRAIIFSCAPSWKGARDAAALRPLALRWRRLRATPRAPRARRRGRPLTYVRRPMRSRARSHVPLRSMR